MNETIRLAVEAAVAGLGVKTPAPVRMPDVVAYAAQIDGMVRRIADALNIRLPPGPSWTWRQENGKWR